MLEMFQYAFMQKALLVGLSLALATAAVGLVIVLRRLSQLGDALSHSSLTGVAIGLIFALNPVLTAGIAALLAAFAIEILRKFFPKYSEIAIAVVFSTGIGLAGVLSGFTQTGNFSSFLFGSIVAISDDEALIVTAVALAVFILSMIFRRALCYISFDEEAAALSALPTKALNMMFTVMTALTISLASRSVGALVVSSLLVIPAASAMQLNLGYKGTQNAAIIFSLFYTLIGLSLSFVLNLKPGGTIVLISVLGLLLTFAYKSLRLRIRQQHNKGV